MGFLSKVFREVSRVVDQAVDFVEDVVDWVEELFSPEEPEQSDTSASGLTVNKSSATAKIPKIYGRRKVGGTRVYLSTHGSKNKYLSSILVQCLGPVHGSTTVTVSDKAESTFGSTLRHTFHHGHESQAADANFVSELSDWTVNHRLQGIAYEAVRYTYDQDKYSGLPVFKSIIDGALLFDPRDNTTAYSNNFALVVLDYFRSANYGVGILDHLIDFESFKTSANLADVSYPSNSNSSVMVKRFACNLAIDTSKTPFDNIKQLVSESRAFLTQTAGQWRYVIQNDATPDHTVTYDDVVGDISRSANGARDKYNRVTVTYVDPDKEWDTNEATYPLDDDEYQTYFEEDNWEESHADITVDSCTNRYQALDIARQALLESRIGGSIAFEGQPWMIKVRCGDLLVMDVPGLRDGTLWRVASRKLSADGAIAFTCAAYDPSIFPWIELPDQTTVTPPIVVDTSTLPAPVTLAYLSNEWNDATVGVLTWSQSDSAYVHDYLIEIYREVDAVQVLSTTLASVSSWDDDYMPSLSLPYLAAGEYYATLRARNALTRSEPTTIYFDIDVPDMGRVGGLVMVGDFDDSLTITWLPLEQAALKHYQVEIYDAINGISLTKTSTTTEIITIGFELLKSIGLPRAFEVRVSGVNVAGEIGEASAIAVSKPAPLAPIVQFWSSADDVKLTLSRAANASGVMVWLDDEDPVNKIDTNQRYKGESLAVTLNNLNPKTTYYIAVAFYDAFGVGDSVQHTVETLNDAVADSIQQLTERDLSLSNDLEAVAQAAENRANKQQVNTDAVAEQLFNSAARAAEVVRVQAGQNDEYYRILNAVVEIDPTTGTITNRAYEYTNGKFSEAVLLIDGVNASISLQTNRIETAEGRLTDAESQLSVQAGLISQRATYTQLTEAVAGAIAAIQPAYATNFNTGLDGWAAQSGTAAFNAGAWIDLALGDIASAMSYAGAENPVIQLTIARVAGAAWVGKIQYQTTSHGYSSVDEMDIPEISDDGQQYTLSVDFGAVTDYTASTITGLRIILGESTDDAYQLHSVQVGKRTAAQAAIEGIQGRVSVAEQEIDAVNGQLSNYVTTTFYEQNTLTQNDVTQTLSSWDAQYSVIATLTELDENGTVTKANSAEQWIDGAESLIAQIAQTTTQNEYGTRMSNVEQTLDAQMGSISQQIISTHKLQVASDDLSANAFLEAAKSASSAREQTAQSDTIALARSETKAVAGETTALAQTVDELAVTVGDNKAEFTDYRRTAIGYCVDASGNPTSHENAESCELAGNTWRGNSSIAEALRNVTVTGTNSAGDEIEVSAGNMYQAILDAEGIGTATAALLAVYGDQLAGIFANAGQNGSSLEFIANQMKFKTENGTKTPFYVEGDGVYISNAMIKNLSADKITTGKLSADRIDANGLIVSEARSSDYSKGNSGWSIAKNGDAEFNQGSFRGHVEAESGTFRGGVYASYGVFSGTITGAYMYNTTIIDGTSNRYFMCDWNQYAYGTMDAAAIVNSGQTPILSVQTLTGGTTYGNTVGYAVSYDGGTATHTHNAMTLVAVPFNHSPYSVSNRIRREYVNILVRINIVSNSQTAGAWVKTGVGFQLHTGGVYGGSRAVYSFGYDLFRISAAAGESYINLNGVTWGTGKSGPDQFYMYANMRVPYVSSFTPVVTLGWSNIYNNTGYASARVDISITDTGQNV